MGICCKTIKSKHRKYSDQRQESQIIKAKYPIKNTSTSQIIDKSTVNLQQEEKTNTNTNLNIINISVESETTQINKLNRNNNQSNLLFSVRDEFNSNTNRNIPYSPHSLDIPNDLNNSNDFERNNNNISNNMCNITDDENALTYRTENIRCIFCSQIFESIREYELHFNICSLNHHNNENNNNNYNNNSAQVNRLQNSNLLALLGLNEEEEQQEFIDWKFDENLKMFKNFGKIYVTKDEIANIDKKSMIEMKNEKNFYKKRIWFRKKLEAYIIFKEKTNSPLIISRNNILEDTFNQFTTSTDLDLRKNIQIYFVEEVAHDAGGVEREWYSSLFDEIFSEKNNFFVEVNKTSFYISKNVNKKFISKKDVYYSFIGVLFSKAMLDKISIPYNLNPIILKYILNYDNKININQLYNIEDIKNYDIEIYKSLKSIINTDLKNNEDIFFVWEINGKEYEIVDGGKNILVSNQNKNIFVNKVIEFICYKSIEVELNSLREGFFNLLSINYIQIFTVEEFNFILSGQAIININDWKSNTIYKGKYKEKSPIIQLFWEVLNELNNEQLLQFYKFCTGSNRLPIDGFCSILGPKKKMMKFTIDSGKDVIFNFKGGHKLITAQTCFNSISLPNYESKEELRKVIDIILENDTNYFGLE